MGHENADLDAAGAAFGLARAIKAMGKPVTIHLDNRGGALENLFQLIQKNESLAKLLVTGEEALASAGEGTLLIVVDTHKPSLLPVQSILKKVDKVAIIDHHRRGTESIEPNSLLYIEAYASSTCELVAELIQYLDEEIELGRLVASALLAGITVDTKNFAFMTGARTFEAASYLRRSGAEPQLVQAILRDPLDTVVRRAAIIKDAEVYYDNIAIAIQPEQTTRSAVIAAQAADALLEVADIKASFVLRPEGKGTAISARSHNEINVHAIMERLGGGGHLTIAGAQLPDCTPQEAKEQLVRAIEDYFQQEE
ncbi:DHH family phosphoesterase [Heliorestis convoluta]|uniref:DHH subfamily 1 protein, putative n=1 Tax=Heliorestis convoluta TaxID=356322 RepID=A0A5Q2N0I5_9FIRM|nr:DHH family phosphoesterase [Heliorestis convoluta]QGG47056.1 DHH subfamily 1 protein, putative [Heliorestis convoluta]